MNYNREIKLNLQVANCHDGHQSLLLEEEQRLHDSVHEWAKEYLNQFRQKERDRNRTRVLELNHFLDSLWNIWKLFHKIFRKMICKIPKAL